MDKFSTRALVAINSLADNETTLSEASNFDNIDFTRFTVGESLMVETGGFIPFGKKLEREKYFLSFNTFKNLWNELR